MFICGFSEIYFTVKHVVANSFAFLDFAVSLGMYGIGIALYRVVFIVVELLRYPVVLRYPTNCDKSFDNYG